jgi:hypothetical protein
VSREPQAACWTELEVPRCMLRVLLRMRIVRTPLLLSVQWEINTCSLPFNNGIANKESVLFAFGILGQRRCQPCRDQSPPAPAKNSRTYRGHWRGHTCFHVMGEWVRRENGRRSHYVQVATVIPWWVSGCESHCDGVNSIRSEPRKPQF